MSKKLSNQIRNFDLDALFKNHPEVDRVLIAEAFDLCKNREKACFMIDLLLKSRLSTKSILAAILIEVDDEAIKLRFGCEILELVKRTKGFFKISIPQNLKKNLEEEVITMIIAYAEDVRVMFLIIIYTICCLEFQPELFTRKELSNILRFLPPLCSRLNLWDLKIKTENLCLKTLKPQKYLQLEKKLKTIKKDRKMFMEYCSNTLKKKCEDEGIRVEITGRLKHLYSIYKKIELKKLTFDEIYDLIALRVTVKNQEDCYKVLGVVHSLWQPLFERIKDYIAIPKPNNYQSLHTTVHGPENQYIEIQIRTNEMNYEANYGIAAHWNYSQDKRSTIQKEKQPSWLKSLLNFQQNNNIAKLTDLKISFYKEVIFVFTKQGDLIRLPKGAKVQEVATALNLKTSFNVKKCKVNKLPVSSKEVLQNGDLVEFSFK